MGNSPPQSSAEEGGGATQPPPEFAYTAFSVEKRAPPEAHGGVRVVRGQGEGGAPPCALEARLRALPALSPLIPESQLPWTFSPSGRDGLLDGVRDSDALELARALQEVQGEGARLVLERQEALRARVAQVERAAAAATHSYAVGHSEGSPEALGAAVEELAAGVHACFCSVSKLVDLARLVRRQLPEEEREALDQGSTLYRVKSGEFDEVAAALRAVKSLGAASPRATQMTNEWLLRILPAWEREPRKHLKRRLQLARQGIPPSIRGAVWSRAVGNGLAIEDPVARFGACVAEAEAHPPNHLSMELIQHDLPRTFHSLGMFRDSEETFSVDLRRVLQGVATYNTQLGYVQGMSYVGGMLLLNMSACEAWLCMVNLMSTAFFRALYSMDMVELMQHLRVYEMILSEQLPEVWEHFQRLEVGTTHYALDWFMTLFTKKLPLQLAARVWDCFMVEGEVYLFRAAVGLLKFERAALLAADFSGTSKILKAHLENADDTLLGCIDTISINPLWANVIQRIKEGGSKESE